MCAADQHRTDIVRMLIEANADLDRQAEVSEYQEFSRFLGLAKCNAFQIVSACCLVFYLFCTVNRTLLGRCDTCALTYHAVVCLPKLTSIFSSSVCC